MNFSSSLFKLTVTVRAGDVDFAPALGHTESTVTAWTVIVSVGLILILIEFFIKIFAPGCADFKKFCVFLLSFGKVC